MEKLRVWEGELLPRSQSCLNTADGPVFVLLREAPLSLPTLCSSSWAKFQPPSPLNSGAILKYFLFTTAAAAAAKLLQLCPTLCNPIDGSPPGSPVPEILQARTLEWVAISFSNAWKWKVKVKSLSCVWLLATPWTAAYQASPSMGFSRQQYWSGVALPSPIYNWVTSKWK